MSWWQDDGDPVLRQTCPYCREQTIVYNGNYFCTNCKWAMGERMTPKNRSIIAAYLTQCYDKAVAAGDTEQARRMLRYLRDYDGVEF